MSGRALRVVFLGHSAAPSGAELGLVDLAGALEDVVPHVILAEDGPIVDRLRAKGISVEVLPLARRTRRLSRNSVRASLGLLPAAGAAAVYAVRLARRLRELQPDLVEANTLKALLYGIPAARLARTPLIWHVHDRIADDYLPPAAVRLLLASARRGARGVIANSRATLQSLGELGLPVTVVHEAIAAERFTRAPARAPRPFTVGMVGRLAPWKGQDVFVRAFRDAFPDGDQRAIVVGAPLFGEDDFETSLHALVDRLGLGGRIELRGFRDDVAGELHEIDALVHASVIPEPFGRVVVEGMAAGLPVIAADAGGPREIITHEVDGLLHAAGDRASLAAALVRLAESPTTRERLGSAGIRRAQDFSPAATARSTSEFYRRVLATTGRAA
jgi:glycosyltransferase involved in cell wall biosynthesis